MSAKNRLLNASLLLLVAMLFVVFASEDSEAATHTVDKIGGSDYTNITHAVENASAGDTTVSYSGQTTRLLMAKEMVNALKDETTTIEQLLAMFDHQEGANDFSDAALNASSKQLKNKKGNNGTPTDAA